MALSALRYAYRSARKPLGVAGEPDVEIADGAVGVFAGNVCEKMPLVLLWMSV